MTDCGATGTRLRLQTFSRWRTAGFLLSALLITIGCGRDAEKPRLLVPDAIVAPDEPNSYRSVQQAINAVPAAPTKQFVVHIKPGVYKEKLVVPAGKSSIRFQGTNAKTTVLTYDQFRTAGSARNDLNMFPSASAVILANEFEAENVTFENSAGPGQAAIAINVSADRCVFRRCRFLGWQDTLLANRGRQYYEDSYIAGNVDFIFGAATAWFERCELDCRDGGAITAASTPKEKRYGFVFSNCTITGEHSRGRIRSTLLGRPWGPHANVIFLNTKMSRIVKSIGWGDWNDVWRQQTVRFAEYRSRGPGAKRASRANYAKQFDDAQAAAITPEKVFDGWDPTRPRH